MQFDPSVTIVSTVAHVIQLSVAPVFLLSGVGALLGVFINRLGRVVDRARVLESRLPETAEPAREAIHAELATLSRRAQLINWATSLCALCAILICLVIAALFIGSFLALDVSALVGVLFVVAMLMLTLGLMSFLKEVHLATMTMRIGAR
jgi:hypothetical protein